MKRQKKAQNDSWVMIGSPLSPKQSAILDKILQRYYEGLTTKREVYRSAKYFGIGGMFESDIPY
jgi:hypothetical protein